jgi:hypothetical protein
MIIKMWQWTWGKLSCVALGHEWTWFPMYRRDEMGIEHMDRCLICARCQALDIQREGSF